jgi:hypothetical protein
MLLVDDQAEALPEILPSWDAEDDTALLPRQNEFLDFNWFPPEITETDWGHPPVSIDDQAIDSIESYQEPQNEKNDLNVPSIKSTIKNLFFKLPRPTDHSLSYPTNSMDEENDSFTSPSDNYEKTLSTS